MTMAERTVLSFDELNRLYEEEHTLRSMPFKQFFGEMDLSQEQKDVREDTAKKIEKFMRDALIAMYYMTQNVIFDYGEAEEAISKPYNDLLKELAIPLTAFFTMSHVISVTTEIISATLNHPDDPYFYSNDRAKLIAENESNSIWNDSQYQDAILTGKTRKEWRAILDSRTRATHVIANGQVVPIDQPFEVGDSFLQFPRDTSLGAQIDEIANCRCTALFY